jgi:hypothetical protein
MSVLFRERDLFGLGRCHWLTGDLVDFPNALVSVCPLGPQSMRHYEFCDEQWCKLLYSNKLMRKWLGISNLALATAVLPMRISEFEATPHGLIVQPWSIKLRNIEVESRRRKIGGEDATLVILDVWKQPLRLTGKKIEVVIMGCRLGGSDLHAELMER